MTAFGFHRGWLELNSLKIEHVTSVRRIKAGTALKFMGAALTDEAVQ